MTTVADHDRTAVQAPPPPPDDGARAAAPTRAGERSLALSSSDIVDLAALMALIAIALWAFKSAFGGTEFWVVGVLAAAVGAAVGHVTDRLRFPIPISLAVWVLVYLVIGGVLGSRRQALAGVIPTLDTIRSAASAIVRGWKELLTTVPPVGATGDLLQLPVFCGMVAAASGVVLARRRRWPVVPALPAAVVLGLGVLCGIEVPVSLLWHGAIFAALVTAWAAIRFARTQTVVGGTAERVRRSAKAVGVLGVAGAIGLSGADAVPFVNTQDRTVWRDTFEPPFDPSVFPSPLGYYRQFLKEYETTPMFEVRGVPAGTPIRMATLDDYDGIVWKVSGGTRALRGTAGYFERVGTDVEPDFAGPELDVEISFPNDSRYGEVWLPTVGEVRSIEFTGDASDRNRDLAAGVRYNRETDTAALLARPAAGDRYTMVASVPSLIDDLDDDAVVAESTFEPIDNVPGQVSGLGSGLVEDLGGIDRLLTLRDFLAQTGFYSDSREGQAAVPPGHGAGRLLQFADASELVGNAEQYAATLALIYRSSGIPARVVIGFVPGEPDRDGVTTVTGTDAEAWVEVLIEDIGWTAIFPTPDRNNTIVVEDDSPRPTPERETQVPPPPPIVDADADTDPASDSEEVERDNEDEEEEDDEDDDESAAVPWWRWVAIAAIAGPFLITLLVVGTILAMKQRRRRRRRTVGRPDERISNGWREAVDLAVDAGAEVPIDRTRRSVAAEMGSAQMTALAVHADEAVFSRETIDEGAVEAYWAGVAHARRSIRADLSVRQRLQAAVSLESFRRAKAERRAAERRARIAKRRRRSRGSTT